MSCNRLAKCPNGEQLQAFAFGKLDDGQLNQVGDHVEQCESCGNYLDHVSPEYRSSLLSELLELGCRKNEPPETLAPYEPICVPQDLIRSVRGLPETSPIADLAAPLADELNRGTPICLGRFELQSELGTGEFGRVFKARDTKLNRIVALKVQRTSRFPSAEDARRFEIEAQSVAQLNHHGIVSVYDTVRTDDGLNYLVTEYIHGQSLEQRLALGRIPYSQSAAMIVSLGAAIQFAHDQGIVHRDIKPSNVLLDEAGDPHLTDFGLAKQIRESETSLTSMGRILGTPAYMSPEQAAGNSHQVDCRSDIYSLGVVLYELLTGERPFQGNRRMVLLQVVDAEPRPPRQLVASIPPDLETICMKAIAKSKADRYQTANEMVDDLQRYLRGEPIKARRKGVVQRLWQWSRRFPLAASLLIALPLVALGAVAYLSLLSQQFVHRTALESTRMEANMLEDINEYYSEQVVGSLDPNRVPATHRYATTPNSIPLPFTFMIDAGKQISQGESGMEVKIFSDYPWRRDREPLDEFELRAIEALGLGCRTSEPDDAEARRSTKQDVDGRSYFEFVQHQGQPALRYARAQIMKSSCIECHNQDPSSPKQDWVEGEVAGVLAITRPLERDIELTQSGLRHAYFLIFVSTAFLTCLTLLIFHLSPQRNIASLSKAGFDHNQRGDRQHA